MSHPRRGRGPRLVPRPPAPREADQCVVYAVQAAPAGLVKFGVAADLERRLSALRHGSPVDLLVRATIPGGYDTEALIFRLLAPFRSHAEWFHPVSEVLGVVDAMRSCDSLVYDAARQTFFAVIAMAEHTSLHTRLGTEKALHGKGNRGLHTPGDDLLRRPLSLISDQEQKTPTAEARTDLARARETS